MKPTNSWPSMLMAPAGLLGWAVFALFFTYLVAGCTRSPQSTPQPGPSGEETIAPGDINPPLASATLPSTNTPSPSATSTSTLEPSNTPAPSETPEPTPMPESLGTDAGTPIELPSATPPPPSNLITFQIQNRTARTIYVFGYGMDKTIPSGIIVYYQAPDWGEINLKVCHKNKDETLGCYLYTGNVTVSNPLIIITK